MLVNIIYNLTLILFSLIYIYTLIIVFNIKFYIFISIIFIFIICIKFYLIYNYYWNKKINFFIYEKFFILKIFSFFIFISSNNTIFNSKINKNLVENLNFCELNDMHAKIFLGTFFFFLCFYSFYKVFYVPYKILSINKPYYKIHEDSLHSYQLYNSTFSNVIHPLKDIEKKFKINPYNFQQVQEDINSLINFRKFFKQEDFDSLIAFLIFVDKKRLNSTSNIFIYKNYFKDNISLLNSEFLSENFYIITFNFFLSDYFALPFILFFKTLNLFLGPNLFCNINFDVLNKFKQDNIKVNKIINDYNKFYNFFNEEDKKEDGEFKNN